MGGSGKNIYIRLWVHGTWMMELNGRFGQEHEAVGAWGVHGKAGQGHKAVSAWDVNEEAGQRGKVLAYWGSTNKGRHRHLITLPPFGSGARNELLISLCISHWLELTLKMKLVVFVSVNDIACSGSTKVYIGVLFHPHADLGPGMRY
jgi:hypothetical protein